MSTRFFIAIVFATLAVDPTTIIAQMPETGAERVGFERTTSHDELLDFLYEIQSQTDKMLIEELTVTNEGRVMPLVILGSPPTASPGTAWFSGRPTVFFTGSVHGNERAGKEGSQQLIRELVLGDLQFLLDEINILIVPSLNPDGAERPARTNSLGYDMNRDFIVAETPEISSVLEGVLTKWWPDIYVDIHNGGSYPYNVTYQATLHPAAEKDLVAFARGSLHDGVVKHLESEGMTLFWYSGPSRDQETGEWFWRTTEPWVRKQHTYGGLQNIVTLLFEIPGRWSLGEQADNAREAMEGLLRYVAENPEKVRETVMEARRRTIQVPPEDIVIDLERSAYPEKEEFFVIERGQNGVFGEPNLVTGENRTLYVPATTRPRPWAYVFDGRLGDMARHLIRHGIEIERVEAPLSTEVERYRLTVSEWAESPYQNHILADVEVEVVSGQIEVVEGMYLVRTAQNGGRLLTHLMEPDTEDSLVTWNFLDHSLPSGQALQRGNSFLPIYRIMEPVGIRSTLVR